MCAILSAACTLQSLIARGNFKFFSKVLEIIYIYWLQSAVFTRSFFCRHNVLLYNKHRYIFGICIKQLLYTMGWMFRYIPFNCYIDYKVTICLLYNFSSAIYITLLCKTSKSHVFPHFICTRCRYLLRET